MAAAGGGVLFMVYPYFATSVVSLVALARSSGPCCGTRSGSVGDLLVRLAQR